MNVTPATPIHNTDVLALVPVNTGKILEIGTGSGALAREIKSQCPGIEYVGVEISEAYAELGRPYCSRMYIENFEHASGELLRELGNTDIVILADVLEHFVDPWAVLMRLQSWIGPATSLVACIPNMQHWSMHFRLLAGDLRYADTGLLDRTHLRFFTRQTMIELFESTGYQVHSISPRIFNFPNQESMLKNVGVTAEMYGLDPLQAMQDSAAFQFVLLARAFESKER